MMNLAVRLQILAFVALISVFVCPEGLAENAITFQIASKAFKDQDYQKGVHVLKTLLKKEPGRALYWFNLANAYFNLGNYNDAISAYKQVVQLDSPFTEISRLYIAKCLRRLGNSGAAHRDLQKIKTELLPPTLIRELKVEQSLLAEHYLNKALLLYQKERYIDALKFSEKARAVFPSDQAHFMSGLIQIKLNENQNANKSFEKALELSKSDHLKNDVRFLLERRKHIRKEPFSLVFEFAGGYNTNVFLDGESEILTPKPSLLTFLGTNYRFLNTEPLNLSLGYSASWEEVLGLSTNRAINQSLFSTGSFDDGQWLLRIIPRLNHQISGSNALLLQPGAGLALQKELGTFEGGLTYNYTKNYPQISTYEYLRGEIHSAKVSLGLGTDRRYFGIFYSYLLESTGDLSTNNTTVPLANVSHGPGVVVILIPYMRWEVLLIASYLSREYKNSAQPGSLGRKDDYISGYLKASYAISPSLRTFIESRMTLNRSTLGGDSQVDDKNFTQLIFLAGLSWDILN